jgi:hypothetical protein
VSSGDVILAAGNPKRQKDVAAVKLHLNAKEIDEAAKGLGLRVVNSKILEAHSVLGRAVEQIGAVAISRGMFLMSAEQAQEAAEAAGRLVLEAPRHGVEAVLHQGAAGLYEAGAGCREGSR